MPLILLCVFAGFAGFVWVGLAVAVFVVRAVPVSAQGEIRFFYFFSFLVGAGAVCIVGVVVVGLVWAGLVGLVGAWGGVGGICGPCWFFPTTCDTMSYFDMLFNFMYEMQKCPFIRLFKFIIIIIIILIINLFTVGNKITHS